MKHRLSSRNIIYSVIIVSAVFVLIMIYMRTPGAVNFIFTSMWSCDESSTKLKAFDSVHCLEKNNIFFIETSHAKQLNVRQACSVESAARHNPSYEIKVLFTSFEPIDVENPLMKKIASISNLQVIRVDIWDVVRDTPVWEWYASGVWKKSKYKVAHLSDVLRLILLWKYGGMYLDLDILVLRSMEKLRNSTIFQDQVMCGNAVMIFDRGHPFLKKCLIDFAMTYDPWNFSENGPVLITRNMKTFCNIHELNEIHRVSCNIDVLPMETGYPITYPNWIYYFMPRTIYTPDFSKSYLIHVWNKLSAGANLTIGTNSVYELAMQDNCPTVYEYAKQSVSV